MGRRDFAVEASSSTLVPTSSRGHLGTNSFLLVNRGVLDWRSTTGRRHFVLEALLPEEIGWLSVVTAALDFDRGEFVSGFLLL